MAALILSNVGSALFGPVGGFAGALAGGRLDAIALASLSPARGSPSRLSQLKVQGSTEGASLPIVHGRARLTGQVIWASPFRETVRTSRPGGKTGPRVTDRAFSISFAVALCEGPIAGVGKVWANGEPLDMSQVTHRVHAGDEDQTPDPLIEAVEGLDGAPAHRGIAHVVFEDLPLEAFGDRIPHLSFEVFARPRATPGEPAPLEEQVRAVCLIPGAGEFALATTPVSTVLGRGRERPENRHAEAGRADLSVALDQLARDLPNVTAVSLVAAWFGDDLRAGQCTVRPKVKAANKTTRPREWAVAGLTRAGAAVVSTHEGGPAYGGSPDDHSVIEAILALKARGHEVTLNPFVMMDIPPGNGLPDPWGASEQAAHPWRGRVTCHPAPGRPGSPDGGAAAAAQIAAFFGTASAADFTVTGANVTCAKPGEWSYRRFILHMAVLAKAAGGVDAFLLGSELVGLTRVRGAGGAAPAVEALRALAGEVRALLGPGVKIGYAADWTEHGAHVPPDAPLDVRFPLDALWADPDVDFIGLDWYAPLTDRRLGEPRATHAALQDGMAGGEAYDWFHANDADRAAGLRTPIADPVHGEPWVFRQKDLHGWWSNPHHPRAGGVRSPTPTAFVPRSKPIRLMELGFPAVNRGANRPSVFPDPKSSESGLPPHSTGARDDLEQRRAIEAALDWWTKPANNPVSPIFGGPMVDPARIHVWTWDARPHPAFPARRDVWRDGPNAAKGHWLPGRAGPSTLAAVLVDVAARAGIAVDATEVEGLIDGALIEGPMSARDALDMIAAPFGIEALNRDGALTLRTAPPPIPDATLDEEHLAAQADGPPLRLRVPGERRAGLARFHAFAPERDLAPASEVAHGPGDPGVTRERTAPIALAPESRAAVARRLLGEGGGERIEARLSPALAVRLEAGDRVAAGEGGVWQVLRVDGGLAPRVELARAPAAGLSPVSLADAAPPKAPVLIGPPWLMVLDLPAPWADPDRPAPLLAAAAAPWPEAVIVRAGAAEAGRVIRPARMGRLLTALSAAPAGRLTLPADCRVTLDFGALDGGEGRAAIAVDGAVRDVIGWRRADLVAPATWRLEAVTRGLLGHADAPALPAGADLVVLDAACARATGWDGALDGATLEWRAHATGADPEGLDVARLTTRFDGLAARPWPPCHARARRTPAGVVIDWIARARGDGDGWGAGQPPAGARQARWRVDVRAPGGDVLRTLESESPGALYPAADEIADFGGAQTQLSVRIFQLADDGAPGGALARHLPVAPL
jgi:hypothetical protein